MKARPEAQSQEMEKTTFTVQLKDMQTKFVAGMEESKNMMRIAKQLKEELLQVREQLDNVTSSYMEAQEKSEKQEVEV